MRWLGGVPSASDLVMALATVVRVGPFFDVDRINAIGGTASTTSSGLPTNAASLWLATARCAARAGETLRRDDL